MKTPRTHAVPTPFGSERAEEIWAQRGQQHDLFSAMTAGEDEYVRRVWDTLGGTSCWSDAFHRIRQR